VALLVSIVSPDGKAREVELRDGETFVGRDPVNNLVLEGRGVSRQHAKFIVDGGHLSIIDLGSTYGTRVNDVPTMSRELQAGDRLTIGMHHLEVKRPLEAETTRLAKDADPASYFSDDVTLDPRLDQRKTIQLDESAIQFVDQLDEESGDDLQVVPRRQSDLIQAVVRLGDPDTPLDELKTPTAEMQRQADYQALVLMYKVSAMLAAANDIDGFVAPVADLVMDVVSANTVVVLLAEGNELVPRVIRHRGALHPGEVPVSRGILDLALRERETVMSHDVSHDERIKAGQSLALYNIRSVVATPLMIGTVLHGILYLNRSATVHFTSAEADLVGGVAALLASGIEQAELKGRVVAEKQRRSALERFHPPDVVDRIFRTGGEVGALEEHRATALVCDLGGFDLLVQQLAPRDLANVLHEYYEALYDKVFANGGSLVKLHDGFALALFGAPQSSDRDAVWAVEAGLALCNEFVALTKLWPQASKLFLRCALDTGSVVAGFVGSVERLEYAALGPPVTNSTQLAAKGESTTLLVTSRTWGDLPQKHYRVKEVPLLAGTQVFQLTGGQQ